MTQRKNTKRALIASVLSMVLCIVMLIGSTFAWFTDNVTNRNNKIVTGNLNVELYSKQDDHYVLVTENTQLFDPDALWEPGYTQTISLKVKNAGELALKYKFALNIFSETPGINTDGESFHLSDHLVFGKIVGDQDITYETREDAWAAAGSQTGLKDDVTERVLLPQQEEYIILIVYMPATVGNNANYRGDTAPTIHLGITLDAVQTSHETDSFGQDYDANVEFPLNDTDAVKAGKKARIGKAYYDSVAAAIENAEEGSVITLICDTTESVIIAQDVKIHLDLGGHILSSDQGAALTNRGTLYSLTNGTIHAKGMDVSKENAGIVNEIGASIEIMNVDVQSEVWAAIQNSGHIGEITGGRYDGHPETYGDGVYSNTSSGLINLQGGVVNSITGGVFQGFTAINNEGTISSITGGRFECPYIDANGKAMFSDGNISFVYSGTGTVTIQGGTWYNGGGKANALGLAPDYALSLPEGYAWQQSDEICEMTSGKIKQGDVWQNSAAGETYYYYTVGT